MERQYKFTSSRVVKREGAPQGQTYSYQSRSMTGSSGTTTTQKYSSTKYTKTEEVEGGEGDIQEYQEAGYIEGGEGEEVYGGEDGMEVHEYEVMGNEGASPDEEGMVTTHYQKKVVTSSGRGVNERVVTQRTVKTSASGSALTGNRKVEQVNVTKGGTNNLRAKAGPGTTSTTERRVNTTTNSARGQNNTNSKRNNPVNTSTNSSSRSRVNTSGNKLKSRPNELDDAELKFQRKRLDRGGNYNNIQVTHIIYSRKPPEFHLIENLHEDGLSRKPLDLEKLRNAGKLRGPSAGKSSFSCSCINQKPIKREKICRSVAFVHCGGEGTKPIEMSNSSTINLRSQKPGQTSTSTNKNKTTTTTGSRTTTTTTTTTTRKVTGSTNSGSNAYSKMVKNVKTGVKQYSKK